MQLSQMNPPPISAMILAVLSGIAGFYVGRSVGLCRTTERDRDCKGRSTTDADPDEAEVRSEEEWEDAGGEISCFESLGEDCKMVFVVRTDLGMTKGKIAAQCGHATLMCYKAVQKHAPSLLKRWETYGQTKIALQGKGGDEELEVLQATAVSLGLVAKIVHDAGRTQIKAGSATVLGIGPAPRSVVDQVTGHLKLL